jgi:hypothetical protein
MLKMKDARISASIGPAPRVFPSGAAPRLGILMLDTRFPRPLGDIGNPASWPVPTLRKVVPRLAPGVVVQSAAGLRAAGVVPELRAALLELQAAGCQALTTSCGFLVLLQQELQAGLRVPLVSSSLLQLPELLAREQRVGVLTISAAHLGEQHLLAAGVARERLGDVVVQGVDPAGEFARAILGNDTQMDLEQAGIDVVAAAAELARRAPDVRSVVLECTNMPPYAERIAAATGLRMHSLLDAQVLLEALHP